MAAAVSTQTTELDDSRVRVDVEVPADATEQTVLAAAKADEKVLSFIAGKPIKREIYVKGRLVNLVV